MDVFEYVKDSVREIQSGFTESDDDWIQIGFIVAGSSLNILPLDPLMDDKERLSTEILPALIKDRGATLVVLLLNTWMVKLDQANFHGDLQPSKHPDRMETLSLHEFTPAGCGRWATAQIERHDATPPTLADWETIPGAHSQEGRFSESIVEALRDVAAKEVV